MIAGLLGIAAGAAAMALAGGSGALPTGTDRAAIEAVVRDYILAHPEIIPEALTELDKRQTSKLIGARRKALETPFAGAWAGASDGDVVLVEFFDYACGFCRAALPDVERLLAEDPKLKVVWRELPILSAESEAAARASLSAARQDRFNQFRKALYASGPPSPENVARAAQAAGVDRTRILAEAKAPAFDAEIDANIQLARELKMSGTPTFVIGDRMLSGAVGYEALKAAIAEARARKG